MFTDFIVLIVVGILWGVTNPFIAKAVTVENTSFKPLDFSLKGLWQMIVRVKFALPFIINQSGSLIYFYSLGQIPAHIMSVGTNSLTLVTTMITQTIINRQSFDLSKIGGMIFVLMGVGLVMLENQNQNQNQN